MPKRKHEQTSPLCAIVVESLVCFLTFADLWSLSLVSNEHKHYFHSAWISRRWLSLRQLLPDKDSTKIRVFEDASLDRLSNAQLQQVTHCDTRTHGFNGEDLLKLRNLTSLQGYYILFDRVSHFPHQLQIISISNDVSGDQFEQCVNLHTLHVMNVYKNIHLLPSSLTDLDLKDQETIYDCASLPMNLRRLSAVQIANFHRLRDMTQLTFLAIFQCMDETLDFNCLPRGLTELHFQTPEMFLFEGTKLPNLKIANIPWCTETAILPTSLEELTFQGRFGPEELKTFTRLRKLTQFDASYQKQGLQRSWRLLEHEIDFIEACKGQYSKQMWNLAAQWNLTGPSSMITGIGAHLVSLVGVPCEMLASVHQLPDTLVKLSIVISGKFQFELPRCDNLQTFKITSCAAPDSVCWLSPWFFSRCLLITTIKDRTHFFNKYFAQVSLPLMLHSFSSTDPKLNFDLLPMDQLRKLSVSHKCKDKVVRLRPDFQLAIDREMMTFYYF
jgi:hypothetical protein